MATLEPIQLDPILPDEMTIAIVGLTPLLMHRWSAKSRQQMADKQQGKTKRKKEPKDPQAEYEDAFYRLEDGQPGFPAGGFKAATVGAARNYESVSMVQLKHGLFIIGEGKEQLVRIEGEPEFTEMPVRIAMGTSDLRYRPLFFPWSATLTVEYTSVQITKESVVALVDAGGRWGGVGEYRPSSPKSHTGNYGRYQVEGGV